MDYYIWDTIAERVNARVVVIEVTNKHINHWNYTDFLDLKDDKPNYTAQYST